MRAYVAGTTGVTVRHCSASSCCASSTLATMPNGDIAKYSVACGEYSVAWLDGACAVRCASQGRLVQTGDADATKEC